jgi:ParB-like chromosome segregation protein Spo0J
MVAESICSTEDLSADLPAGLSAPGVQLSVELLPIADLVPADSPRLAGINIRHAEVLAESEDDLPAILVQRGTMRVIDGMHRIHAAQLKGCRHIAARLVDVDDDAAFLLAVETNMAHGLPLSLADRKAAAGRIILTRPYWSDRAIAKVAGLSGKTVGALRKRGRPCGSPTERRMGQDGKIRPLSGATGRRLAGELLTKKPDATVREIALAAGISAATVRDVRDRLRRGEDALTPGQQGQPGRSAQEKARSLTRTCTLRLETPDSSSLEKLKRDPSLRYSDTGRTLLRLLHMRPSSLSVPELIKVLPAHCLSLTAEVSRQIALEWMHFAAIMDERDRAETA